MSLIRTMFILAAAAGCALAQAPALAVGPAAAATAAAATVTLTEGEVRKVDKAQGRITLRHGRIENLDMDAMTMVFQVADARLLDGLKPGDKVRFAADSVKGQLTVTAIEPLR